MNTAAAEIVPAILRSTFEAVAADWQTIYREPNHIQIDITDGIFAGDGSFRDITRFKNLPDYSKIELHLMVHTPTNYLEAIIDLNPARCIFHLEAFTGTAAIRPVYERLRAAQIESALALNPESPSERVVEYADLIDYVLFMGYNPGWANQPLNPRVYNKINSFHKQHPDMPIAVDGHVTLETLKPYREAGATILCANTAVFGHGDPVENYHTLQQQAALY